MQWGKGVIAVAGSIALTACGSDTGNLSGEPEEETAQYSLNPDTGETTASMETGEGTATVRSGPNVPIELPAGFGLFPGAEVVANTRFDKDGDNQIVLLSFASDAGSDEIAEFYREAADAAGFAILIDTAINDGVLITGENDNGAVFTLSTSRSDGKTIGQLTTGLGPAAP